MSEGYRDWYHPDGGLPEQAPEGLVDSYAAPWLVQRAGETAIATNDGSSAWVVGVALVALALLALAGWWAWRHRAALRLWVTLRRLERRASAEMDAGGRRELLDELVAAIGAWQHGGRAPWRDRLAEPWSAWVREIDHGRFGGAGDAPDALVWRLRSMRREVWRGQAT